MPQVASESNVYALNRPLAQSARQAYSSDRAPVTPFESLIDDTPPPAPERRAQSEANDNPPRADRSQPRQDAPKTARSDDKARDTAGPDKTEAPAKADSAPDKAEAADADKPAIETETAEPAAETKTTETAEKAVDDALETASGDAEPAGDGKPDDAVPTSDLAAVPANSQIPAITNADAIAVALVPAATPDTAPTAEPAAAELAIEADGAPKAPQDLLAALQAKSDKIEKSDKSGKKAEADKLAVDSKAAAKTTAPLDPETNVLPVAGEPESDPAAHARAVLAANTRRGASQEGPATPAADNANTAAPKAAADIAQPVVLTAPAHTTAAPAAVAAPAVAAPPAPAPAAAPVPIAGVAIEITNKALAGKNQFDIRLDPPDLGRIHVRLDVDRDGNVISHMVADRTDTLDLLRRDMAGLERALQDAGLKTSDNSLQFSLRDQSANQQQDNDGANTAHLVVEDDAAASIDAAARDYARNGARGGGLDIRV